jgi:hypothetical protein
MRNFLCLVILLAACKTLRAQLHFKAGYGFTYKTDARYDNYRYDAGGSASYYKNQLCSELRFNFQPNTNFGLKYQWFLTGGFTTKTEKSFSANFQIGGVGAYATNSIPSGDADIYYDGTGTFMIKTGFNLRFEESDLILSGDIFFWTEQYSVNVPRFGLRHYVIERQFPVTGMLSLGWMIR